MLIAQSLAIKLDKLPTDLSHYGIKPKRTCTDTSIYMPESKRLKAELYILADDSTPSVPETLLDIVKYAKVKRNYSFWG